MKEIRDRIYDILEQDVTIQGLTGWVVAPGDTRIYLGWPPERRTVPAGTPAFITMDFLSPGPMDMSNYTQDCQIPDEVVDLNVWANTATLMDQIAERIMELLWLKHGETSKTTEILTASYRLMHAIQESVSDITEVHEGTGQIEYWRKYMRIRYEYIYLRTAPVPEP